jgi:hypothetical protein
VPALEHLGRVQEDPLTLRRRRLRPLGKRLGRCFDRPLRVGAPGSGGPRHGVSGEGIEVLERLAVCGVDPLSADVLAKVAYCGLGSHSLGAHRSSFLRSRRRD